MKRALFAVVFLALAGCGVKTEPTPGAVDPNAKLGLVLTTPEGVKVYRWWDGGFHYIAVDKNGNFTQVETATGG